MARIHFWSLFLLSIALPASAFAQTNLFELFRDQAVVTEHRAGDNFLMQPKVADYLKAGTLLIPNTLSDRMTRFRTLITSYAADSNSILACLQSEGTTLTLGAGENLGLPSRSFVEESVRIFNQGNIFTRSIELSQSLVPANIASQDLVRKASREAIDFMRGQFQELVSKHPCLDAEETVRQLLLGAYPLLPSG